MRVERIADSLTIASLYAPESVQRIAHDLRPAIPVESPHARYWGAYLNDRLVGGFLALPVSSIERDVHALLWPSALPYARKLGLLFVEQMFADLRVSRLTAQVMSSIPTAVNYCQKIGFKREGYKPDACLKDGKLIGVHILGLTRSDWSKTWDSSQM